MAAFDGKRTLNLRAMGFCGADDSVDPALLQLISTKYSWVEWGVLFRTGNRSCLSQNNNNLQLDLEGTPRYASRDWVNQLAFINKETGSIMRLAGHLCGNRCQEVIALMYHL